MIDVLIDIILFILKFVGFLVSPFLISMFLFFVYFRFVKKMKLPTCNLGKLKKRSVLVRLFYDFPKRFVLDKFTMNPNIFREKGVHIISGKQGCGKSITLTYMLLNYMTIYPKLIIKTNYGFAYEKGEIRHWKDIVDSSNGEDGEIDVLDEIQNWFNSLQSKDFPPEMMNEITQQRKQRKCIIGTSQVFTRISKPLREQTFYVYEPVTFFNCITFVRKYEPEFDDTGAVVSKKIRSMFFFVHNDEIRNSYDTLRKIKAMCEDGFKPDIERSAFRFDTE